MTIATLIADVGTMFTGAIEWVGDVATAIGGSPILLMFCLLPLIGLGVGLFKRLISVN